MTVPLRSTNCRISPGQDCFFLLQISRLTLIRLFIVITPHTPVSKINQSVNQRSGDVTKTHQQRPDLPTVTLTRLGMRVNTRYINSTKGTSSSRMTLFYAPPSPALPVITVTSSSNKRWHLGVWLPPVGWLFAPIMLDVGES